MRMLGMYWFIDRWRKSTAYTDLTLEQQGAYRNLLDEAWLRGGPLPDDERILAKASGDVKRWPKLREVVMRRFRQAPDGWHNDTLDRILSRSKHHAERQQRYRERHGGRSFSNMS